MSGIRYTILRASLEAKAKAFKLPLIKTLDHIERVIGARVMVREKLPEDEHGAIIGLSIRHGLLDHEWACTRCGGTVYLSLEHLPPEIRPYCPPCFAKEFRARAR